MKNLLLIILPFICLLAACSDSDNGTADLQLSQTEFKIPAEGGKVKVSVTCNSTWKVISNQNWCIPNYENGDNNGELILTIHPNSTNEARKATVTIMASKSNATIQIEQSPSEETVSGDLHYKLPVIFHILYKNANDRNQNIDKGRIEQIVHACNLIYKNKIYANESHNISQDMNLEFVLATETPDGTPLEEPGVERIRWGNCPMSCEKFMNSGNLEDLSQAKEYAKMLWNPKLYINIFVYPFTEPNILGISHMPYYLSGYALDGLTQGDYYLHKEVFYPHCISINSTYIYENSTSDTYVSTDVFVTTAHEMGHYLGLLHAFAQEGDNIDLCKDTDYCSDTPTYNSKEYQDMLGQINVQDYSLKELCTRHNCEGKAFISRNIMDYAFCYSDQFTPQQKQRIRHVLSYSPLIPGPKKYNSTQTRSSASDERPIIQFLK